MALTDVAIKAAKPAERPYKIADGGGMFLQVTPAGGKLWRLKYRFDGREKLLSIGQYPEISLSEARKQRDAARSMIALGTDPSREKRRAKVRAQAGADNTFDAIAAEYVAKRKQDGQNGWAPATGKKADFLLSLISGPIGRLPIAAIEPADILAALRKIEARGNLESARRALQLASAVFRHAIATARLTSDPTRDLRGALLTPKVKHHAAITDPAKVGALLRAIDGYEGQGITSRALQLLPYVFVRPGELRNADWSEIDFDAAVWIIPAEKMKMRKPHHVHLSRQSLENARGAFDNRTGVPWLVEPLGPVWGVLGRNLGSTPANSLSRKDLHKHITAFAFMLGRKVTFETQATVTIKAAELMGRLHDALEESGYIGHDLEQFLVRTLFCLFADNTGIFQPKDIFLQFLENDTTPDGSDMGRKLSELFDILDTPEGKRLAGTDAELDAFPYVNGALFTGRLRIPKFDATMREALIDACRHDWSAVSPAIFGSLFQSVMDAKQRRAKGAHYTSEDKILKVIGPLFLDDLQAELATIIARRTGRDKALAQFQDKLTRLTFFDPTCGCGNFLVIAYREIRRLELEALKAQYGDQQIDAALLSRVTVDQFYGIEYEEFPARIAEVAMWMMDHIANNELNQAFRLNYARIPLKDSAHILHGDALEQDWDELLPPERCSYIMGNPPFIGAKFQSPEQRGQVRRIASLGGSGGTLDYVAAWFIKAGQLVQANPRIRLAFVSTNSITQGEQVAQLWPILFDRYKLEIAFAHRTFSWGSEARGKAHVHVVIIGLAHRDHEPTEKRLFSISRY